MVSSFCPYCKEKIHATAILCKHCHSSLQPTRKEMMIAAIIQRINSASINEGTINEAAMPKISKPSVTPCKALCHHKFGNNKVHLNKCLNDCEQASAIAAVAERMHRELMDSFIEHVWAGGDIDPVPFEKAIRERFSHLPQEK